ncbi:MAG: NAD(+)/NADH kinase, partial [Methylocella sp.]
MPPSKSAKHRFERIAFLSSGSPEANAARAEFVARYGTIDPESADVVVALGGDGLMLLTLHRFMGKNKPIYGMKRGSVGFLMNEFHGPDLDKRLDQAEASIVHPLLMEATGAKGESIKARAVNEVSILRQAYQAAKMRISIDGKERLGELIA